MERGRGLHIALDPGGFGRDASHHGRIHAASHARRAVADPAGSCRRQYRPANTGLYRRAFVDQRWRALVDCRIPDV